MLADLFDEVLHIHLHGEGCLSALQVGTRAACPSCLPIIVISGEGDMDGEPVAECRPLLIVQEVAFLMSESEE